MFVKFDLLFPLAEEQIRSFGQWVGVPPWGDLELKTEALAAMRGEFSCVYANSITQTIYLFRDPLGIAPLYYRISGQSLTVSSSITELIADNTSLTLNRQYLQRVWWEDFTDLECTAFNEIRRVPPGHLFFWRDGQFTKIRFIDPIPRDPPIEDRSVHDLRAAFFDSLERRVPQDHRIGVLLSGGLDSSLLTCGFDGLRDTRGLELHSLSLNFRSQPDGCEDLRLILSAGDWKKFVLEAEDLRPEVFFDEKDGRRPALLYFPTLYLFKPLFAEAKRRGLGVVCTGLGGDDVFSSSSLAYSTLLRQGRVGTYLISAWRDQSIRRLLELTRYTLSPLIPNGAIRRVWRKRLDSSGLKLRAGTKEFLADQVIESRLRWRNLQLLPHLRNDFARCFMAGAILFTLEHEQELAQQYGLRISYPLLDYDLIQTHLRMPIHPGFQDKPYLREIARGIVPERLRHKQSTQDYNAFQSMIADAQASILEARQLELIESGIADALPRKSTLEHQMKMNYFYRMAKIAQGSLDGEKLRSFQEI